MVGAGYSGGELLLGSDSKHVASFSDRPTSTLDQLASVAAGQQLFLKNCAHCHGADGHGDEGPDLHNLDWTDEQIATRIRNGKKGQMTAFAGKYAPEQIREVIAYLRSLK
jgi:cytochrome c oxidase cbb3-type subunit 3